MGYKERKEQYKAALMKWKAENNIRWYASIPQEPKYKQGESVTDYAKRLVEWKRIVSAWQNAPKPEDFDVACPLNEHFEIRINLVLTFGTQHVKLFGFRLLSELDNFQDFLFKQGIRYEYIERQDGSVEIDIDRDYDFIFSEGSARYNLVVSSADRVHVTGFYFYNDSGFKNDDQRVNTIADIHDFFMKDKRVITKKIKSEKGCHNFIQDYIAPFEAARVQDDRFYITTIEEYKKMPKYRLSRVKSEWMVIIVALLVLVSILLYGLTNSPQKENTVNTFMGNGNTEYEYVYICTGPKAKSYHIDGNCYGLQSCSADIEEITVEEAQDEGRKPCRYCCK